MYRIICLVIGYAVGCVQTAYIVGRLGAKIDIREHGSGNAGTTNVVRVMGPQYGLLVFVFDVLKGILAFLICALIFKGGSSFHSGAQGLIPGLYGGIGTVLGHDYPVQLKFKGGKGIATTVGIIFMTDFRISIPVYLVAIIAIALTRYISLGSLIIAGLFPILLFTLGYDLECVTLGIVLGALAYYQHRGNIERLIKGNERKFNFKKQE